MDNPFADLIPKKAGANPFADLIPKAAPLHDMQRKPAVTGSVTEAPLHDMARPSQPAGPKPTTAETIDQSPFAGQGMRPMDPLAAAARDPMLPGGARGLAAVGQEAINVGRQPFDVIQQQLQRLREGGELTPQDAGDVLGASMAGGLKEAPGGARGVPLPEAPKPRVEPPPLGTSPAVPAPSPFENLIPRNAEGRPVVPPGGLQPGGLPPEPKTGYTGKNLQNYKQAGALPPAKPGFVRFYHGAPDGSKGPNSGWVSPDYEYAKNYNASAGGKSDVYYVDIPVGDAQEIQMRKWDKFDEDNKLNNVGLYKNYEVEPNWRKQMKRVPPDPRAAEAGQAAVARVADRVTNPAPEPPKPPAAPIPSKAPAAAISPNVHPKKGDYGETIKINNPHTATHNPQFTDKVETYTPGSFTGMRPWSPPNDWSTVSGKNPTADATPFVPHAHLPSGAGALIESANGKGYWVVSPTNKFGGFENTLAKGKIDKGSGHDLQTTAIKEIWEETGLKVDIKGHVGDLVSPYSKTRYYLAKHKEGSPAEMGWESQAVHWVPKDKLVEFLKNPDEKKMVADYLAKGGTAPAKTTAPKPTKAQTPLDAWHAKKVQSWYDDMEKEAAKRGFEIKNFNEKARVNRAKKQGFDTNLTLYHGAGKKGIWRLRWKKDDPEPAVFVADKPQIAASYGGSGLVMELWGKRENFKEIDWKGQHFSSAKMSADIMKAKAEGHDGLVIKNIVDLGSSKPHNQYAFFKPGNLRSKGAAAFDPKVKEPDAHLLSSAGTPTADLLKMNTADYEDKLPKAPGAVQLVKQAGDTLKAILHPQSLNDSARRAEGSIRKNIGRSVQDSERAKVAMEPYRKALQKMTTEQQLGVLKWLQQPEEAAQRHVKSGSGTFDPPADLKPFLQAFKDLMLDRRRKLEARTKTGDMGFKDDYVSQMWRDPDAARDVLHSLGPKEGSNSFTKRSVIDDYEAGIKAGLIPLTTDLVEIAMRYVENVDRFIAINDVLEEGAANKDIVWRAPEHAPNGWVKLDGRARSFKGGAFQDAYAPPGYADVYNAFVSKPPQGRWGDILSGAQKVANSVSAFKLAVSGYHALNIAGEANVAGLANAIDKLAGGDVLGAALAIPRAVVKSLPVRGTRLNIDATGKVSTVDTGRVGVTSVARGRQMLNTYITGMGSPEMQKVVQLAVDANFRVAGKGRVADEYRFSSMGSLWDSWRKGLLKGELAAMGKDIKERPLVGSAKAIVSTAARALETLSDPVFKHYIPMVKNGAYFDMVKTWLDAHPTATNEEQVAFARKAADIIDNRFGEMNQDNIFWQRWQKQLAQTLVVSYSYELGTARSVVGAAKDAVGLARGKGWTPNLSYAIALPVMVGMMGAAYQYMKTGKPPDGLRDAMYPQTGGQDPMSGQPARAVLPSYMSQFVNAYYGGLTHELAGKKNGVFDLLKAAFTGTDWRGDPITAVDDSTTDAIKKWLGYAASTWEPILATQTKKGGTGISGGERFMGVREAPMFANDPQAYKRMMDSKRLQGDAEAAWHDRNAKLEAEGKHPNFMVKRMFIQHYIASHKPKYGGTQ